MNFLEPLPPLFESLAPSFSIQDPMDAPPLRWGILGTGMIARIFVQDVPRYSRQIVSALGSRSLDRAKKLADETTTARAFGSYQELVDCDEVDIVYIATPHSRHLDDALLALQAGKHVLVEKAFTLSTLEAEEIFSEAKKRGLFVMEAMWSRHLPHYRYLQALQADGQVGAPVSIAADHGQMLTHVPRLMQPDLGGGALLDLGVYPIHFAQMLLGNPKDLQTLGRFTSTGVDAATMITGKYRDALSVASANLDGISATSAWVTFEHASFELPNQFYRPGEVTLRTFGEGTPELYGETAKWDASVPSGYQFQAADAARCISEGLTESPIVTWQDTLDVMRIMDRAREQMLERS